MQSQSTPQILYDVYQDYGQDLGTFDGDLQPVSGSIRSQQRVLRRLMTAVGSYIWHTDYGAGLPSFVGEPVSPDNFDLIRSLILSNMFLEASVAQDPQPTVSIQSTGNGIFIQLSYTENPTKNPIVLSFNLGSQQ